MLLKITPISVEPADFNVIMNTNKNTRLVPRMVISDGT